MRRSLKTQQHAAGRCPKAGPAFQIRSTFSSPDTLRAAGRQSLTPEPLDSSSFMPEGVRVALLERRAP
jgi:hypothetical protein